MLLNSIPWSNQNNTILSSFHPLFPDFTYYFLLLSCFDKFRLNTTISRNLTGSCITSVALPIIAIQMQRVVFSKFLFFGFQCAILCYFMHQYGTSDSCSYCLMELKMGTENYENYRFLGKNKYRKERKIAREIDVAFWLPAHKYIYFELLDGFL